MSGLVAAAAPARQSAPRPVSRPHDRDEREAERAAEVVAAGGSVAGWSLSALPPTAPEGGRGTGSIPGTYLARTGYGDPDDGVVRRCAASAGCLCEACASGVDSVVAAPGTGLDAPTRSFMEAGFGVDFGRVRLHSDSRAAASARAISARAYTLGDHVVTADGPPPLASRDGRRLLAHELAHVVQHDRSRDSSVVHRQAAPTPAPATPPAPAPATPPAPPTTTRTATNTGRGGSRVDAVYDPVNALLTVQMKILFDWTKPIPKEWPESRRNGWRDSFIRTVTRRWSYKHFLVPQQPCTSEPLQVAVRLQVIPVTASPHFTMHLTYSETQSSVTENRDASGNVTSREADLDVLDDAMRSDQPQVPAEHEFGHMLGLPHIRCDKNDPECYGVTREEKADVLGKGSFVSPRDYEPFAELMVSPLSTCTWRVSPRSVVPTSRAPGIGALVGGILGAVGGGILGALAAASLGPLGGFLATLGGAVAGGVGGALLGRWLATPEVPS